jgi:hypothetical protein
MPVQGEFQADSEPGAIQSATGIPFGQIGKYDTIRTITKRDNLYALRAWGVSRMYGILG